ncbi:MAG TPA: metallophosphoesterase [Bryobacteraceae bacterium]|nr:metallophosphoesterase [Bryobacteraceae bacterium]
MRPLLLLLPVLALRVFAAEPVYFVQASDPQFGMYTDNRDFAQETANWTFAIANINRLHPAFLVVTGDLVNKGADAAQIAEYKRISGMLDPSIHLYSVPGNHDVGNDPTPESLAEYRKNIGPDYYSFREGPVYGIVLDSSLFKAPAKVMDEAAKQEKWLEAELEKAKASSAMPVVFLHISLFLEKPDEPEQYFNQPVEARKRVLELLHRYDVRYVFAGHYHRNDFGKDGDLEMITTNAAGKALGAEGSGFRIAEVSGGRIVNEFYSFGKVPNQLPALVK